MITWGLGPLRRLARVDVRVRVTKVAGAGPDGFGIACRTSAVNNSYFLVIGSSQGGFLIEKNANGTPDLLTTQGASSSDINSGNATNRLRAICEPFQGGVRLTLFVNGVKLSPVTDLSQPLGPAEIGITATGPKGTEVLFDDFSVVGSRR